MGSRPCPHRCRWGVGVPTGTSSWPRHSGKREGARPLQARQGPPPPGHSVTRLHLVSGDNRQRVPQGNARVGKARCKGNGPARPDPTGLWDLTGGANGTTRTWGRVSTESRGSCAARAGSAPARRAGAETPPRSSGRDPQSSTHSTADPHGQQRAHAGRALRPDGSGCFGRSSLQSDFTLSTKCKYYGFLFVWFFNCVLVRESPTRPGTAPAARPLSPAFLAVYWKCSRQCL